MPPKGAAGKDKTAQNTNNAAESKIHCDEAAGHLKTGNYNKALHAYSLVRRFTIEQNIYSPVTVPPMAKVVPIE